MSTGKHLIMVAASLTVFLSGWTVLDSYAQRPMGEVKLISGPSNCDGYDCYELEVISPQLVETDKVLIKVGEPVTSVSRGTIMFLSGGNGTALWAGGNRSEDARRILEELRDAGFRTVQFKWERGWLKGASGQSEGPARLASRPATVIRWVYDNLHQQDDDCAFCATGHSGGSMQISYTLAQYGQADIFDAVLLSGGPPLGRLDLGLIPDDPKNEQLWFPDNGNAARIVDASFGFPSDGTGPGARNDSSFRKQFQDASISFGNWDYNYPKTMVWFLFGERDNWIPQAMTYYERLIQERSPFVHVDTLPNAGHRLHSKMEGAEMIRDILLKECRRR